MKNFTKQYTIEIRVNAKEAMLARIKPVLVAVAGRIDAELEHLVGRDNNKIAVHSDDFFHIVGEDIT